MDTAHLILGLVLFMGGLGMMAIGVVYLDSLSVCGGSITACGGSMIAYSFMVIGVVFVVVGAIVLARARFAPTKDPYPRQYSTT